MSRQRIVAILLAFCALLGVWWLGSSDPTPPATSGGEVRAEPSRRAELTQTLSARRDDLPTDEGLDANSENPTPRRATELVTEPARDARRAGDNDNDNEEDEDPEEVAPRRGLWIKFGPHRDLPELTRANWATLGEDLIVLIDRTILIEADAKRGFDPRLDHVTDRDESAASLERFLDTLEGKIDTQLSGHAERNHPLVVANLVAYALDSAGQPLTESQVKRIESNGELATRQYASLKRKWENTKPVPPPKLERFLEELETRRRFDRTWAGILDPVQRAYLFDERTRDRWGLDPLATDSPLVTIGEIVEVDSVSDGMPVVLDGIEHFHKDRDVWDPRGRATSLLGRNRSGLVARATTTHAPKFTAVTRAAEIHANLIEGLARSAWQKRDHREAITALLEDPRFRVPILVVEPAR